MKTTKRIGILGGSFDPPTLAHSKLGQMFLDELQLDEIRYVLANQNPLKFHVTGTSEQRWDMIQLMLNKNKRFAASNIEISHEMIYDNRQFIKDDEIRPSYTYNTMTAFQMCEPESEFIFLGGSDILRAFYKWHKAEDFIKNFRIAIAVRPPYNLMTTLAPIVASDRERFTVVEKPNVPDIASTDVRTFFSMKDFDRAKVLLQPEIFDYIMDNQLYQIPQEEAVSV